MSKMTGWFPASVKPARVGWYQCRFFQKIAYWRFWDGYIWKMDTRHNACNSSFLSDLLPKTRSNFGAYPFEENEAWRGLASDPSKGKK